MTAEVPTKRRPSRWHRPLWWTNLALALVLVVAYASTKVDPQKLWPLAFFGMAYPFVLPFHAFFLVWWGMFRPKRMLVSALAIALGWGHVGEYFQMFGRSDAPLDIAGEPFKVMSYNVRLFDLYNWNNNAQTRNEIFDVIAFEHADILCTQEFFKADDGFFNTKDTLMRSFGYSGCHEEYTHHTKRGHHFGIATFSSHPIVGRGSISFPDELNNLCIWTDILVRQDTIRVYNAHLASIRFGDRDYRFMKDLDTDTHSDSLRRGGLRIMNLLRNAFIRRADEVRMIKAHMARSPHPVLYCGDMNDTPMSYSYAYLAKGLTDAFIESGRGVGHTYIGAFPSFRIDHILHAPELMSWNFRTLPDRLSDHRPIVTEMAFKKP
ncbi:MAG: endonuclease/exonuclease/phosphatase family protein [Flavobacteriales bacterium]|nr:endonuclease/exonuclease/phosphatase family protein [Flavobacteriales bacterium]